MLAALDHVTAAAVAVGAAFIVLEIAGRSSSGRKSAVAAGLVAAAAALAAGWFDVSLLGFAILVYLLGSWTYDRARRPARRRRRRELGEQTAERAVDRSGWPTSGPIGRFSGVGVTAVWFTTQLLTLLNPFQMLEVARQTVGDGSLRRREARSRDDGRTHLIRGSVTVARGERVRRGQALGRCGHTGHSTEPHLHFHLQDSADPFWGMGLPVRFSDLLVDGAPADETLLTAGVRVRPRPGAGPPARS